ncbi:MAG: polymer-forming cytoskeletal protein [Lachnospiraceae bacterium]|nr:polymer-forming cytoskeletal protein [Lachnospiraceae bacterium]
MNNFSETAGVEVAFIPKGTIINGNIDIDGKLDMHGEINGNIVSNDRVTLAGNVMGDIKANDIYAKDSFIEGKIECVKGAEIRENTIILGDIDADSLVVDGSIQGKLDIKGGIIIGEKAIIDSDIKAKSIQVSNGAAINGHCSLCYAELNINDVFPETEAEAEKPKQPAKPKATVKSKK